jgi:hypothetical protein
MTNSDDTAEKLGKLTGLALSVFLINCLRAWLLSLCAAIFFPSFALGFWQWWLLAYTFRLMTTPAPVSND